MESSRDGDELGSHAFARSAAAAALSGRHEAGCTKPDIHLNPTARQL
jgi:hypothetical protein